MTLVEGLERDASKTSLSSSPLKETDSLQTKQRDEKIAELIQKYEKSLEDLRISNEKVFNLKVENNLLKDKVNEKRS